MLNVMLISMPYTILNMPSTGIAQLQAVIRENLGNQVQIDSAYCYVDFAEFFGLDEYGLLGLYDDKGLHDWMFRLLAFDNVSDNREAYEAYYFEDGDFPRKRKAFELAMEKREALSEFLDTLIDKYKLLDYQVVGFTSMMSQNVASFAMARRLKQHNPAMVTCLGGPNADYPMGKVIADNVADIDYVFAGEGLVSFPRFLEAMLADDTEAMGTIKGVMPHMNGNSVKSSKLSAASLLANITVLDGNNAEACDSGSLASYSGDAYPMDQMPLLEYEEYLERIEVSPLKDILRPDLTLPFQTSTGCWWADKVTCSFCGLTPHSFRQMSSAKARDYISGMIDRYKGRFAIFEAVDPCMPVEYPTEVFPYVNQSKEVVLQYEVKANMPREDMESMARANVILPQPGIESFSTRTLKIMRKGVNGFHNVKFLKDCVDFGLYPIWNYLYGFPNQDYDELDSNKLIHDMRIMSHFPPPSSNVPIVFQRYSEYFNDAEKYGLELEPLDFYGYVYPFSADSLSDLAYSFIDKSFFESFMQRYSSVVQEVNIEVTSWMYKYRDEIPKLYFMEPNVIYDSRYEKPAKYKISDTERDVLRYLDEPRSTTDVQQQFGMDSKEVQDMLGQFSEVGFLFSDRNKFMSIICERCALTSDRYQDYYINFVRNSSTAFD